MYHYQPTRPTSQTHNFINDDYYPQEVWDKRKKKIFPWVLKHRMEGKKDSFNTSGLK